MTAMHLSSGYHAGETSHLRYWHAVATFQPTCRHPSGNRLPACKQAQSHADLLDVSATRDPAPQLSHKFRSANRYEILAAETKGDFARCANAEPGQGADTAYPPLLRNAAMHCGVAALYSYADHCNVTASQVYSAVAIR